MAGGEPHVLGREGAPLGALPASALPGASGVGRAVGAGAFPGALGAASRSAARSTVSLWTALPPRWLGAIVGQAVAAPASGIAGAFSDVRGLAGVPIAPLGR